MIDFDDRPPDALWPQSSRWWRAFVVFCAAAAYAAWLTIVGIWLWFDGLPKDPWGWLATVCLICAVPAAIAALRCRHRVIAVAVVLAIGGLWSTWLVENAHISTRRMQHEMARIADQFPAGILEIPVYFPPWCKYDLCSVYERHYALDPPLDVETIRPWVVNALRHAGWTVVFMGDPSARHRSSLEAEKGELYIEVEFQPTRAWEGLPQMYIRITQNGFLYRGG